MTRKRIAAGEKVFITIEINSKSKIVLKGKCVGQSTAVVTDPDPIWGGCECKSSQGGVSIKRMFDPYADARDEMSDEEFSLWKEWLVVRHVIPVKCCTCGTRNEFATKTTPYECLSCRQEKREEVRRLARRCNLLR